MSYWESNIKALEKKNNRIYKYLTEFHTEKQRERNLSFITENSRDAKLYTIIKKEQKEYRLNSSYRPEEEAKRWAEQFTWDNGSLIRMFGFGNSYFLKALTIKLKEKDHLLVVEPSIEILEYTLDNFDLLSVLEDDRIEIYLWHEMYEDYQGALNQYVNWMMMKRRVYCEHPQYERLFEGDFAEYLRVQRTADLSAFLNRNTEVRLGRKSVENALENLKYIKGSVLINDFAGILPKEVPVIIVASGPSLDKNIELLKQAKGHALILACDSAQRILKKHEIIPDAVVTIDARKWVGHFKNCGFEKLPVLTTLTANYNVLKLNKARKIWYCDSRLEWELFQRGGLNVPLVGDTGGCVATTAFYLAVCMGCKRIILVGQDLAYSGEVSHAGGRISPFKDSSVRHIAGNDGNKVISRYDWIAYLDWYEKTIRRNKNVFSVVNATEGGAKIEGTEYIPLQEAIDRYCKVDFDADKFLNEIPSSITEELFQNMIHSISDMIEELEEIRKDAKSAVRYCNDCILDYKIKHYVTNEAVRINEKIIKQNEKIMKSSLYEFLQWLFCEDCVETVQELNDFYYTEEKSEDAEILETYTNSRKIFESVVKAAETLKEKLKATQEELLVQEQGEVLEET